MKKLINDIIGFVKKVIYFFTTGIWNLNPAELSSKWKARLVKNLRVIEYALKQFSEKNTGFQSIALAYFCTTATIPFIAVSLVITGGVGLQEKLMDLMYANFGSYPELVEIVMNASTSIVSTVRSGLFGVVSAVMFAWPIIWMMNRVEKVFNDIWGVTHPRKFFTQVGIAIGIIILAPFIIMLFFSGSIVYSHVLDLVVPNVNFSDSIKTFLGWLVFCGVSIMVLSVMYKFVPAAKVKYKYALNAAILAGIAFTVLQYLYLETQVMVIKTNALYGTLAAVPLFIFWLRYGWMIILYGAQFSYSFQMNGENQTIELK